MSDILPDLAANVIKAEAVNSAPTKLWDKR